MKAVSSCINTLGARVATSSAICAIILTTLTTVASAEVILNEDFNDQNDDGWLRIDSNVGLPWGPGNFDASSQAYNLTTTGIVPAGIPGGGFMGSLWEASSQPAYSNGFARAKVRSDTAGVNAAIAFRTTGDLATGFNTYLFFGGTDETGVGGFSFNRIEVNQVADSMRMDDIVFGVGEDWWIEAGGIGDQLSMKVWRDGDPEPDAPQLTLTDATLSTGMLGVESNVGTTVDQVSATSGQVNATFDDFSFRAASLPPGIVGNPGLDGRIPPGLKGGLPATSHAVPEPTSAALSLLGCCILCLARHRRHPKCALGS